MSKKITVEDCRAILRDLKTTFKDEHISDEQVETLNSLSEKEKFIIAKQLLNELEVWNGLMPGSHNRISDSKALKIHSTLASSFEEYSGISRDEYIEIISQYELNVVIAYLVRNKSFPIDLLANRSLLRCHESKLYYWVLESYVNEAKKNRYTEIVAYYRSLVPSSDTMTDEMVLKVADA